MATDNYVSSGGIFDPSGKKVASGISPSASIAAGQTYATSTRKSVANPQLWDIGFSYDR